MRLLELVSIILNLVASILAIIFYFIPEISSPIAWLDIQSRILLVFLLFVLGALLILYDRLLRPRKITERYSFDPFSYYPEEVKNCKSGLPYVELFTSSEGLKVDDIENIIASPREFKFPPDFDWKARYFWKKIKGHFEKEGREIGTQATARLYNFRYNDRNKRLFLYFQKAQYWQAHVSNFNLDWKGWTEHLRDKIAPGPKLSSLRNAKKSANHLGLNCVIVTSDGKIFLQRRSSLVAVDPGLIGLSAAGHMRWESRREQNVPPSPFVGMFSEIEMELGITKDEINDIRLVAICRELNWGGKPTAFFVVHTDLTWEAVEKRFGSKPEGYWETEELIPFKEDDIEEIKRLIKRDDVGLPTKACLYYYSRYAKLQ